MEILAERELMEDLTTRGKPLTGLNWLRLCEIWGSYSCVAEDSCVLGCDRRWLGGSQRCECATYYL